MGAGVWMASSDGLAQPLYFFLQHTGGCQGPLGGPSSLQQVQFWLKCLASPSMGSYFTSGEYQQILTLPIPSAAHPLSTSGGFSNRTQNLPSICLPIPAHTAEI